MRNYMKVQASDQLEVVHIRSCIQKSKLFLIIVTLSNFGYAYTSCMNVVSCISMVLFSNFGQDLAVNEYSH